MSDLQCAATFVVLDPERCDVAGLGEPLRHARVAAVYAGPSSLARSRAAEVAALIGLDGARHSDLDGPSYTAAVEALADLHRGETVVLVPDEGAVVGSPGSTSAQAGAAQQVEVDADGWRIGTWPPVHG